ncbi:probable glycosyl transferase [Polaribacter irgensii 23-P]|uniref:Probable glycosyl transferase n=1 Tax=Polaribacter irgensii 23-P TaxID=313594 RepID=A4BZ75_9FLAO|nr:glycosyltransferase family 4 protein [Polaribacter irgensii]EAR12468.1 probable glycosyl transferase [Polaribacter irgensii 23-P]
MRIGMILDAVFPPDPRVENEAVSLVKAGHEVFLFCLHYGEQKKLEVIHGIQVKRYLSNRLEYKLSALAYTIPLYTFLMKRKICQFIKENKIEILHVHDMRIADAVFSVNKKNGVPIVLDLHENRPEIMRFYPHLVKFPGKYLISPKKWKSKEEKFIRKATKVIVVTSESRVEITKRIAVDVDKIVVVPNTVRENFYLNPKADPEIIQHYSKSFVLLYIGDTGLRRGLETAIRSINLLRDKIENIKLVIVGKNTTDWILKKLAKDLGVEAYIDFLGWKDQHLFQSYILSSSICISPLHRNLHHDTTYANKIFQYMSLGRPVLGSNATAQERIIKKSNAGLIHQEKDVQDFSNKVLDLYNNKSLREAFSENGSAFIKNQFSWEKTSKKLIHLYDNIKN